MNIFLKYTDFLNEGLSTARKTYVSSGKITQEDFLMLSELDPTKTKKYLDKICEFFLNGHSLEQIKDYVSKFDKLSPNLDKKDIRQYSFDEIKSTLDGYTSKSQIDTLSRKDIDIVFENERYLIVRPTTHEQAVKYGRDTNWCITGAKGGDGKDAWNDYYTYFLHTFYFIIDKTLESREPFSKVCISVDEFGKLHNNNKHTVNAFDENIDGEEYIKSCGLDRRLFKTRKVFTILELWHIDTTNLKNGVYYGTITAPMNITEFKGFYEEFGLEINTINGNLSFYRCESLTSIGVLPENIDGSLTFTYCKSLESITKLPKIVNGKLYTDVVPFFEDMYENEIREEYYIGKNMYENYHYLQYYQQQSKNKSDEPLVAMSGGDGFVAKYKNLKSVSDIQQKPSSSKPTYYSEKIKIHTKIEVTSAKTGNVYIGTFLKGIQNKDGDYIEITFLNKDNSILSIKPKKITTL